MLPKSLLLLLILPALACSERGPQRQSIGSPSVQVLMDRLVASYAEGNPAANDHYRVTPLNYSYTENEVSEMLVADSGRFAEFREVEKGGFYERNDWDIAVEGVVAICCTDCQCAVYYPVGRYEGDWYTATLESLDARE